MLTLIIGWFPLLTKAVPGEALPAFDTTLFILNAMTVALAAVMLVIVTKGKLGYAVEGEAGS